MSREATYSRCAGRWPHEAAGTGSRSADSEGAAAGPQAALGAAHPHPPCRGSQSPQARALLLLCTVMTLLLHDAPCSCACEQNRSCECSVTVALHTCRLLTSCKACDGMPSHGTASCRCLTHCFCAQQESTSRQLECGAGRVVRRHHIRHPRTLELRHGPPAAHASAPVSCACSGDILLLCSVHSYGCMLQSA